MEMDGRPPYDDYPVVFLPPYENPPAWIPPHERVYHPDYNNELTQFLPRTIQLQKPSGAQVIPDSDAHRAGLQEGDQVLAVNHVDFQDIEHGKAVEILKTAREINMQVRFFPYTPPCKPSSLLQIQLLPADPSGQEPSAPRETPA
ncbi:PDZ domain-containing protein 11 isoform X2 [Tachyglossus aculeatus]|uniref:PDZ domain-containing protein 11 isoform X2 n=1 Tax=Tachyglossus aculeatus TaxID=9261 RepID=UPI0018F546B5|nr:PDZ domain-containing protein 11 isoform X2 [Tachyglossus aculeatus]